MTTASPAAHAGTAIEGSRQAAARQLAHHPSWTVSAQESTVVEAGSGTVTLPHSDYHPTAYPWPKRDGWVLDGYGFYQGECTSFTAWAVRTDGRAHSKPPDFLGNAAQWTGADVGAVPREGDVAQ